MVEILSVFPLRNALGGLDQCRVRVIDCFGVPKEAVLAIPAAKLLDWYLAPNGTRKHIQNALPELGPSQREFLLTGLIDDEWDELFS